MLEKNDGLYAGSFPTFAEYYRGKSLRAKVLMPLTKWLRAINVERFISPKERHLDIGCGDGFLVKRSKCKQCIGIDEIYGERFCSELPFERDTFDYVTMLAVLEHLENAEDAFREIHRVCNRGGLVLITTPRAKAEPIIRLYVKGSEIGHRRYFDIESMRKLAAGLFEIKAFKLFMFGFNQLFVLEKI